MIWRSIVVLFAAVVVVVGMIEPNAADTVALWLFDESVGSSHGTQLHDASGNGLDLELGVGEIVAAGKTGNGLACPVQVPDFVARRRHVNGTRLNIGNHDWTIEWWQRRLSPVAKGHADWIYLVCDQEVDPTSQHWEAGFRSEARFTAAGLWHHDAASMWNGKDILWSCFVDKYDEVPRISFVQDVNPMFYEGRDSRFHHIAWVYDATIKRLIYFEDGQGPFYIRDGAPVAPGNQTHAVYGMIGSGELQEYPERYEAYAELGKSSLYVGGQNIIGPTKELGIGIRKIPRGYDLVSRRNSERTASSIIDELRVSDAVLYRQPFSPPTSFASKEGPPSPTLRLSTRQLDLLVLPDGLVSRPATVELVNSAADRSAADRVDLAWSARADAKWIRLDRTSGVVGTNAHTIQVSVDPKQLWPSFHQGEIVITTPDAAIPKQTIQVNVQLQSDATTTWLLDEPVGAPHRFQLEDESVNGFDLMLGPGGEIIPGHFGNALDPRKGRAGHAAIRRYIDPSHHNLGDFDWAWQCWLRLDEPALEGDVLFMLRENVAIGPYPFVNGVGRRCGLTVGPKAESLTFVNDASGLETQRVETDKNRMRAANGSWFHLALAYDSEKRMLLHWIDGQLQDHVTLSKPLQRLPRTGENVLSVGKTVDGKHPWRGLIDEIQLSAELPATGNFSLPPSRAPHVDPLPLRVGPHLLFDDHLIEERQNLTRTVHRPEFPVPPPDNWEAFLQQHPNHGDTHFADLGPRTANPNRRFLRYSYVHSLSAARQRGGIYCYYGPTPNGPWIECEQNPVLDYIWAGQPHAGYSVGDHWPVMFDPATNQLVMFFKTYPLSGQHPELSWYRDERFNYQNRVISGFRRHQGITVSKDGLRWSNLQTVFVPDDDDYGETQFQTPMLYKRGDLYLALAQHLRDDVDRSVAWASWATSRDLYHWTRHRAPFIDFGRDASRGDKVVRPDMNAEIYIDDRWMYFPFSVLGSHKPPRAAFRTFARLPVDRFVSHGSHNASDGRLKTKLLRFDDGIRALQVNCSSDPDGEIRVQIVDDRDRVVPGFSFADCDPVGGEALKKTVTWRGVESLEALSGKTFRFEFSIRSGRLFAFYLVGPAWKGEKDYRALVSSVDNSAADERLNQQEIRDTELFELLEIDSAADVGGPIDKLSPQIVKIRHTIPAGFGYGGNPSPVTLTIVPSDPHASWTVEENIRWLTVEPGAGQGSADLKVQAHGLQLGRGDYLGKLSVRMNGGDETVVPVHFRLE